MIGDGSLPPITISPLLILLLSSIFTVVLAEQPLELIRTSAFAIGIAFRYTTLSTLIYHDLSTFVFLVLSVQLPHFDK